MPRISDARRLERRTQIVDAARGLFMRNGFHATTMDDIITAAGMSAGGVYRYFPSKEAIISAIAEQVAATLTEGVRHSLRQDPPPTLTESLGRLLHAVDGLAGTYGRLALQVWGEAQRDDDIARIAANEMVHLRDAIVQLVVRAQATGELDVDADPTALGHVVFSLVPGYLVQRRVIGEVDRDAYICALTALLTGAGSRDSRGSA
jgi:AcrR family transcriptional regulator